MSTQTTVTAIKKKYVAGARMVRRINEAEWNIWKQTQIFIFIHRVNILSWWHFKSVWKREQFNKWF